MPLTARFRGVRNDSGQQTNANQRMCRTPLLNNARATNPRK